MTSSQDYPAAHSMDTTWFAVDADGHVAAFETGEAGAVPTAAYVEPDDAFEAIEALGRARAARDAIFRRPTGAGGDLPEHVVPWLPGEKPLPGIQLFLDGLDAVRSDLDAGRARETRADRGVSVRYEEISRATFDRLHAEGACRGCVHAFELTESPAPASIGLFEYEHTTENWISGPYRLRADPAAPIRADDLPRGVRKRLVTFTGRFRETPLLQPAEIWPSDSWGAAYLATDGKTVRPLPGHEADFENEVSELRNEAAFVVESAPQPGGPKPPKRPWWKLW